MIYALLCKITKLLVSVMQKNKAPDYEGGYEEIPVEFRPSEWFAEVLPKRSPYFPQLGDHLVYYRQGHQAYIEEVEKKKAYEVPKKWKKTLPYINIPDLPVRFIFKFLIHLKLTSSYLTLKNLF